MVDLTPDCQNCAALCCVALAFDAGAMFAFDKPAGTACQHLSGHACAIHSSLETAGLKGCVHYQCDGAGQRVVQEVFAGQSWQSRPALLAPMLNAFRQMRQVHALVSLLTTAKALPLTAPQISQIDTLLAQLCPESWTGESLAAFERADMQKTVHRFLQSLKAVVPK